MGCKIAIPVEFRQVITIRSSYAPPHGQRPELKRYTADAGQAKGHRMGRNRLDRLPMNRADEEDWGAILTA